MIVFKDTLGNVDDNNGRGYWSAMYIDSRAVPGSSASVANLFTVASLYGLKSNTSYARSLYEADFTRHPSVKRMFARNYLATFDVHDAEDVKRFRQELVQFTRYPELSEWDLLAVKGYYAMIGETDSSRKYDALILEKYPGGSRALQTKSLKPAMEIDQTDGLDQKWKKYQAFKTTYGQSFPDALSLRQMHSRMGQILRGMVFLFAENDGLKTWEQEVNALDAFSRYSTYRRTAEQIEEKVRMSVQQAHGSIRPESPLYQSTKQEEQLLAYAESLARRSAEWYRTQLAAPRDPADPASLQPTGTTLGLGDFVNLWNGFAVTLLLWLLVRPSILLAAQLQQTSQTLKKFKMSKDLFDMMLSQTPEVDPEIVSNDVVLGNANAPVTTTLVTSPSCGPCTTAHLILDELFNTYKDKIRLVYQFTVKGGGNGSVTNKVAREIVNLGVLNSGTLQGALRSWYAPSRPDFDEWAKANASPHHENTEKAVNAHERWCSKNAIHSTPTLLIQGHRVPDLYALTDIAYFLRQRLVNS